MPDTLATTPSLRTALAGSYAARTAAREEQLRRRLNDFVAEARARGWSAERVLRGLERVVIDMGAVLSSNSAVIDSVFVRAQQFAVQAINRYYHGDLENGDALER